MTERAHDLQAELDGPAPRPGVLEVLGATEELLQLKREVTAKNYIEILRAAGLACDVKSRGALVVIRDRGRTFDFWPGTGRWRERDGALDARRVAWHRPSRRGGATIQTLLQAIEERK